MGVNFGHIKFFDLVDGLYPFAGKTMAALGSQEIHEPQNEITKYADINHYGRLQQLHTVGNLFRDRYGLQGYFDIDMNQMSDIQIDLSQDAPKELTEKFDILLNGGTAEHIFNIGMVFKNMHKMLKNGGIIINIVPYTWFMHGFYNIDPKLLYYIDKFNNYSALAQAFFFQPSDTEYEGLKVYKIMGNDTSETCNLRKWLQTSSRKTNILYMHASRKNSSAPFQIPYDVYD